MSHDPDAYDRERDDAEHDRTTEPSPLDRRDWLDGICGATTDHHDLDSEGVMFA